MSPTASKRSIEHDQKYEQMKFSQMLNMADATKAELDALTEKLHQAQFTILESTG